MWVLNNYVISLGIYLVLRVVLAATFHLQDRAGHGQDGGDQPLNATIWKGQGLFRSSVETTRAWPKGISLSDTGFESCKTLILAASPGSRSKSMTADSDGLRAGHRRHAHATQLIDVALAN
jgi:hypothetical protein